MTQPQEENPRSKFPLRSVALGLLLGAVVAVVAIVGIARLLAPQRGPPLTSADLEAAIGRWMERRPRNYDMDITVAGRQPGEVRVQVRDAVVVALQRDGRAPPERTWDVWSVEGLFETLQQDLELAKDPAAAFKTSQPVELQLAAEFNAEYGYPQRYYRAASGADIEMEWTVTRFNPLP